MAGTVGATGATGTASAGGSTARDLLLTALAPASWATVYAVTATLLPDNRPMLAAALRALPAGLLLLAYNRKLPHGSWWWKSAVLAVLNFGAFLPLIFFAAYRLPGGVAATIGAVQPLLVAGFSLLVLRIRTSLPVLLAAVAGVGGVALMTLTGKAALDAPGVAAALLAVALIALSIVLTKKWGSGDSPLVMTGWQLTIAGLLLTPFTLLGEGLPAHLTGANIAGYTYIGVVATAAAYPLFFRGIGRLAPTSVSLLSLVGPPVAALIGVVAMDQTLTLWQVLGLVTALAAVVAGQTLGRRR
ncbi:EamA family transporter [Streptomyces huiliensis]|uniref:EamA family transporter n=1 Tax=Streptomyces huiliensis TaxID=2876027 RepID=UPI001CBBE21B|nr:EamA family transporter [Streptomyces huiliensis]